MLAGGGFGFLIVGREQVLEDISEEFWVEGNFLVDGCVLLDGEVVGVEDIEKSTHPGIAAAAVAVGFGEVDCLCSREEEFVGNPGAFLFVS